MDQLDFCRKIKGISELQRLFVYNTRIIIEENKTFTRKSSNEELSKVSFRSVLNKFQLPCIIFMIFHQFYFYFNLKTSYGK